METIKTVELPDATGVATKTIKIARTKTGVPCLWESSTNFADLRRATVVYNADASHKTALFMKKNSEKQALVPISAGDYISKAFEDKNGYAISVFRIHEISPMKNEAVIYPVFRRSSFEDSRTWEGTSYESMVNETIAKLDGEETTVYAQFETAE
jgi:hypothetical protein